MLLYCLREDFTRYRIESRMLTHANIDETRRGNEECIQ